jgi:hypothetical protein
LNSNHPPYVKRGLVISVFTKELPPFAKNVMICLMKLVALGVIFSLTIIVKVSFTRLLIPSSTVRTKWKSLWVLCTSHMWKVFQRSAND